MSARTICEHHHYRFRRPERLQACHRCGKPLLPGDDARRCEDCFVWCHYDDSPKCEEAA